ncbi:MAG: UDP-N-acetylmuramate dehydrogenase [Dokdonia sp.]|jgi:UDP-N-acetylmuramate dehydrogenase|nr:UDP-N-acetylenolpyruvoylglucosamine reductase [Cytophagaceae bacterium]|tara:strand:+ start:264 stop:1283 length:1020 start_codon:yes stop_codon:yes gene_type:complete
MEIQEHISLSAYNTFGIDVKARYFVSVTTLDELQAVLALEGYGKPFVIGGGSNMLLTQDIDCLVIHLNLKGITIISPLSSEQTVVLEVAAGENWHEFVMYCVDRDYGGVENLSLIPGNVGTSPIQNIGAYGVELKDVFHSCLALDRTTLQLREFTLNECAFGYRDSVFKNELKDQYIITAVRFALSRKDHKIQTTYGAIADTLAAAHITSPGIKEVSKAVIAIRQSKLPDPAVLGNSGSFFKNPVVDQTTFDTLSASFPDVPFYPVGQNKIKIPAGWLIEQAGFKGKRFGDAGVHDKQALVLVNHGNASGQEIWELALKIQAKVASIFGITIIPEVNVF